MQTTNQTQTEITGPVSDSGDTTEATSVANRADSLTELLGSEGEIPGLTQDEMVKVTDLAINESLPTEEWFNVLLLGSDEHNASESTRTDSIIICSINKKTGEVKLSSIMRDTAVTYPEISGQDYYRINTANYFGGELLAVRTVNRLLNMNIQYYVRVNFYGFQEIAELLGGIDIDITENERQEINYRVWEVHRLAETYGIDESNLPLEELLEYGANTHLDGRQTLAYARIRKLDSDYARTDRQRKVLTALLAKVRGADLATLTNLAGTALKYIHTNLDPVETLNIAHIVTGSSLTNVQTMLLPVQGTYTQDTRQGQDMLFDTDWARNASELRAFIYG